MNRRKKHEAKIINLKIETVLVSQQAKLLCEAVDIRQEDVIEWCLKTRGFVLGGGDVIDFLSWKQAQKALDGTKTS